MKKSEFKSLSALEKVKVLSGSFDSSNLEDMQNKLSLINVIVVAETSGNADVHLFLDGTIDGCFAEDEVSNVQDV